MFDENNKILSGINNINDIYELLKTNTYNALIDIGSYFVGYTNKQVSSELIKIGYSKVVYLDESNDKMLMEKIDEHNNKVVSIEEYTQDPLEKLIVYFDQKHITGIDIKIIPFNARGLITIGYETGLRDYSQGAFRLRKLNITQHVNICISSMIYDKIKDNIKDKIKDKIKERDIHYGLFMYLYEIEETRKNTNKSYQNIHNLKTLYRNEMIANGLLKEFLSHRTHLRSNCYIDKTSLEFTKIGLHDIDNELEDVRQMVYYLRTKDIDISPINQLFTDIDTTYHIKSHVMESQNIEENINESKNQNIVENQNIRIVFDMYKNLDLDNTNYTYDELFTGINYGSIEDNRLFICTPYSNIIYMSKTYIKDNLLTEKSLYCFRLIKTINNKVLIVTMDEYEKIYTIDIEKDNSLLDMSYDLHPDHGIISLVKYIVSLEITNTADCCYMIDNLITNYDLFVDDILTSSIGKSKISIDFIYNIILYKRKIGIKFTQKDQLENIIMAIKQKLSSEYFDDNEILLENKQLIEILTMYISLNDILKNTDIYEIKSITNIERLKVYENIFTELYNTIYGNIQEQQPLESIIEQPLEPIIEQQLEQSTEQPLEPIIEQQGGNSYKDKYLMYKKKYLKLKQKINK